MANRTQARRRRRRRLPGEGPHGSDFDIAQPSIEDNTDFDFNIRVSPLTPFERELETAAADYEGELATGRVSARHAISTMMLLPRLRGFWPMSVNNQNGGAYDVSGQTRFMSAPGAAMSYAASGPGGLAPAAVFDGSAGYLTRANENGLNLNGFSTGMTWIGWVYPDWASSATGLAPIVAKGDEDAAVEFAFRVDRSTLLPSLRVNADSETGPVALALGQWNFVAGSWDFVHNEYVFVVNTSRRTEGAITVTPTATLDPLYLGRMDTAGGTTQFWQGMMSLMGVCEGVLSEAVVDNVFDATRRIFGL